jgi:hypothetical protein
MSTHARDIPEDAKTARTCAQCEYFDGVYGDCLSHSSPRFETKSTDAACDAFYPDTTAREVPTC